MLPRRQRGYLPTPQRGSPVPCLWRWALACSQGDFFNLRSTGTTGENLWNPPNCSREYAATYVKLAMSRTLQLGQLQPWREREGTNNLQALEGARVSTSHHPRWPFHPGQATLLRFPRYHHRHRQTSTLPEIPKAFISSSFS